MVNKTYLTTKFAFQRKQVQSLNMWCKKKHCLYSTVDINKYYRHLALLCLLIFICVLCMYVRVISYMLCSVYEKEQRKVILGGLDNYFQFLVWTGDSIWISKGIKLNNVERQSVLYYYEISTCLRLSSVITDNQMWNRNINIWELNVSKEVIKRVGWERAVCDRRRLVKRTMACCSVQSTHICYLLYCISLFTTQILFVLSVLSSAA